MKVIDPENLVFIDETGVILGLSKTHARFLRNATQTEEGTRVYETKPFYRGQKVTVIGAISMKEVVALMTINNSMDSFAFARSYLNIFCCQSYGQEQ